MGIELMTPGNIVVYAVETAFYRVRCVATFPTLFFVNAVISVHVAAVTKQCRRLERDGIYIIL
ncbi:hypothetical protein D3C80_1641580 [compost metagenome]